MKGGYSPSTTKAIALFIISMICMLISLPPAYACDSCRHSPPRHGRSPPHHGGGKGGSGGHRPPHHKGRSGGHTGSPIILPPPVIMPPPVVVPPVIPPPVVNPPIILPPPVISPPIILPPPSAPCPPPPYSPPSHPPKTCPIDALKLGLCLDVLGGLVHVVVGDPVKNICCPVIQGLLELEAAICLCTAIRLKLLNLNVFIPLALQVLATCGVTPPPGFTCPPIT